MKFKVPKSSLRNNIRVSMNRLGYHVHTTDSSGQYSFVRRLRRLNYPRFHVYINERDEEMIVNIHMDEKKPSYGSGPRHSGQYEGELVEQEARRIHATLLNQ